MAARKAESDRRRLMLHSALTFVCVVLAAVFPANGSASSPEYDIVIRHGRVLDGTGSPWVRADVAIKEGRFAKIGVVEGRGAKEIDAAGLYVSPGWIDVMDQSARALMSSGLAENKLRQGITSAIAGESGTPVPAEKLADFFTQLEVQGISLNFGTYYGATQARVEVIGSGSAPPDPAQLERIKEKVRTAMEAGAFGISTALIYPPAVYQSTGELIELAKVVAEYGGFYATHLRDESRRLVPAIEEAIMIGERSGAKVEIFHLKAAYAPGWGTLMKRAGQLIDSARDRGVDVAADMYPYTAGGTGLEVTVPSWVFAEGLEKARERLQDPQVRARLKKEIAGPGESWSNMIEASGGWDGIVLANPNSSKWARYRFRSIAEIAEELGRDPADVAWDMVLDAAPNRAWAYFHMMHEQDVETALRFPWTSIGSDAGAAIKPGEVDGLGLPHPRSYGTFPRIIAEYVRERGVLSLREAIRKMSAWPAIRHGLTDRGVIREGLRADVVVFDYDTIDDTATWESGTTFPTGIEHVIVNGVLVIEDSKHTGAKPGIVLRGPGFKGRAVAGLRL